MSSALYVCAKCDTMMYLPSEGWEADTRFICGLCEDPPNLGVFLLQAYYDLKRERGEIQ